MVEIRSRRALVTGATGGLGGTIARALHARGAQVVITGRRACLLDRLAGELGERAESVPADLTSASDVAELAERAGLVDTLVANAGVPGSSAATMIDQTNTSSSRPSDSGVHLG